MCVIEHPCKNEKRRIVCVCEIDGRWSWVILVGVMDDNITCKKLWF